MNSSPIGGSFALGGLVARAIALSQSALAPRVSRLADEHGQRRVLLPLLAVHASALTGLVVAAELGGRGWMLVALAVLIDHASGQAALDASIVAGAVTALTALLANRTLPAATH